MDVVDAPFGVHKGVPAPRSASVGDPLSGDWLVREIPRRQRFTGIVGGRTRDDRHLPRRALFGNGRDDRHSVFANCRSAIRSRLASANDEASLALAVSSFARLWG